MESNVVARPLKRLEILQASGQRVFTTQDLAVLWEISDKESLYSNIGYYVHPKTRKLQKVHKGVYALAPALVGAATELEIANKLVAPSYISLHTALSNYGINFQYYTTIYSMSLQSKQIQLKDTSYSYHRLKEIAFVNQTGLRHESTPDHQGQYWIAEPERAVCDSLYLFPGLHFDNLSAVNSEKLLEIAQLYRNQRLLDEVTQLLAKEGSNA